MAIEVRLADHRAGIVNAYARMPFRFGVVTMRASPLFTLEITLEDAAGRSARGYAADFLAYRWFDKRPEKSLADNCADLIRTVEVACALYRDAARAGCRSPFALWQASAPEIERTALAEGFNRLGASFGSAMLERAVIDALGRLTGQTCFELIRDDWLGIDLGTITPDLAGRPIAAFLPEHPLTRLHLRHTVGLIDPLTAADVTQAVADGLPETLEDYLDHDGISHLKLKVAGTLSDDLARLATIAALLARRERRFRISLDGNEQYKTADAFLALIEAIRSTAALDDLWRQTLFVEQPLDRSVALDPGVRPALQSPGLDKPVIIDEADGWVGAFKEAVALGYKGTSHKNCKGIYKSLHNMAFAMEHNRRIGRPDLFLSAEDLSNLPVVALQADLAMVALLGIDHVERNGHHYFRGLGHLSPAEQQAALSAHPDLYERRGADVVLKIDHGTLSCASLQVPGMGFSAPPDMDRLIAPDRWSFHSLGQET